MDGRGASSVVVYSLLIFRAVLYAGDHCQELTASRKQEIAAYVNKRYKGPVAAPLVLATVEAQEQCYLKLRFTPSEQRGRDLVLYLAPDRRFLTSELFDSTVDPVKADRAAQERLKKALAAGQVAILGNEGAPITLTVFSDFQCPFCRRQAAIIREDLLRTHGTDVRVVFRHLPLPGHDWARKAAEETACVAAQNNNAFGGVHDFLFEHQDEVSLK